MIITTFDKITSTNEYIKKYVKGGQNVIIRANEQTGGMGTKGRSFISQRGGIYMTYLRFYQNMSVDNAFKIMVDSSMAVVKTLLAFGINAKIKWPNDVIVNDKKICGILINNCLMGKNVAYSTIGIGLNVNNQIADEIKDIATSMQLAKNKNFDLESVFLTLVNNLNFSESIQTYKEYSLVLGKKITVTTFDSVIDNVVAVDITNDGRLVLDNGQILSSAEVKIKMK